MRANGTVHPTGDHGHVEPSGGITLREHFAGLAMQGLMHHKDTQTTDCIVVMAVRIADALIQELNKEPKP